MLESEVLARVMYDVYCAAVGGKAFNGDPLPPSHVFFLDQSKQLQANAWRKTAIVAIRQTMKAINKIVISGE